MKHKIVKFLLIAGVVIGFGSGFARLAHRHHRFGDCGRGEIGFHHRKQALMNEFAQACVNAAKTNQR